MLYEVITAPEIVDENEAALVNGRGQLPGEAVGAGVFVHDQHFPGLADAFQNQILVPGDDLV